MSKDNKDVIIHLFEANLPGSIISKKGGGSSFVQQTLKNDLINEIKQCGQSTIDNSYGISEAGRQVFFVDGTRGAGKTTFLNGVVERFSSGKENAEKEKDNDHVFALRSIDPTKLPAVEPILITVIAQLNAVITNKLKCCGRWDKDSTSKENWEKCLNKISTAIKLLNSKDYNSDYFDDALDLHAQLSNSADGLGLAEQFSKLLDQACDILKCKVILLTFDDIDTQFKTGWDVLEAIRKYFNSPKLVVLMTGDLRLYSQLIRGEQYENYHEKLLKHEDKQGDQKSRRDMVDHLEQQYLLKLVPVHRRYVLKNLYQLLEQKNAVNIEVITTEKEGKKDLRQTVEDMLKAGLRPKDRRDLNLYANEILQQPIRLVIQILQRFYQQKQSTSANDTELFNEAIRSTMLSSIYQAGLAYDNSDNHIGTLCKDIFNYTLKDGDTNTGFYLRPQSDSESLKNSAIYLASMVSNSSQGCLWKALHLMMVGCGSVSLYERKPEEAKKDDFITYMALGRNESLMHWANRSHALLSPIENDSAIGIHPGLLRLGKKDRSNSFNDTTAYQSKKEPSALARVAVEVGSSDLLSKTLQTFVSLPNLIAGIADLLHSTHQDKSARNIGAMISQLSFIPTCSAPQWITFSSGTFNPSLDLEGDDNEDSQNTPLKDHHQQDDVIRFFTQWLTTVETVEGAISPSAILLGKIWTRLYFNLAKIAERHKSNLKETGLSGKTATDTNAAKIMRFNVIALLHAVLVEETYHHVTNTCFNLDQDQDRDNPNTGIKMFSGKLNRILETSSKQNENAPIESIKKQLPIFYCLVTCPLLLPFLMAEGAITTTTERTNKDEQSFENSLTQLTTSVYGNDFNLREHQLKTLNKAIITAAKAPNKPAPKKTTAKSGAN